MPKSKDLVFPDMEITERPDFIMRDWWVNIPADGIIANDLRIWKIRNRLNPDSRTIFALPTDGSVAGIIPKELADTRPELFALKKDGTPDPDMPNLTNPESVKMVADVMKQRLREPGVDSVAFALADGAPIDYSPESMKHHLGFVLSGARPTHPDDESVTEEWIYFINNVAVEMRKEFPDSYIATNGYMNRSNPPVGIKPIDNSVIMYADIFYCAFHPMGDPDCWMSRREGQQLSGWCKVCDNVWQYGYQPLLITSFVLLPDARNVASEVKLLKSSGAIGFFDEARIAWAEYGILGRYTKARMSWNPDMDPEPLWADFYSNWYGAAARPMRAYYNLIMDAMGNYKGHGHEDRNMVGLYTPKLVSKMEAQLAKAEVAADSTTAKSHVEMDRLIFKHLSYWVQMNRSLRAGNYLTAAERCMQMLAVRKEINSISPFLVSGHDKLNGKPDYTSGAWYWTITDRMDFYQNVADKMNGKNGSLVALLPERAYFKTDPQDEGISAEWHGDGANNTKWDSIEPALPTYLQGYQSKDGYAYAGVMWYRYELDIPAGVTGQKVRICIPEVETDAWLFVNGEFVGHRGFLQPYERPAELDMDISALVKPGRNVITVRSTGAHQSGPPPGGICSRGFVYTAK